MNKFGFFIRKISVLGENLDEITLNFKKGLNVISGPSNTGKSYIFSIIDYMFGAKEAPKELDESVGYTDIIMEIESYEGMKSTLKRTIGSNEIITIEGNNESVDLITKRSCIHNKKNQNNISAFCLLKSGYDFPISIIKNNSRQTNSLSFRDVKKNNMINEELISKENSPIFSGINSQKTREKNIFKYLLTGISDIDINKNIKLEVSSKDKFDGQIELIERLLGKEIEKLKEIEKEEVDDSIEVNQMLEEIKKQIQELSDLLDWKTSNKKKLWHELLELNSKKISEEELIKRFELLKEYYYSDLKRLEFVIDGDYYFSQLNFTRCPSCNGKLKVEHTCGLEEEPINFNASIVAETENINMKLVDLNSTINQANKDYEQLLEVIRIKEEIYEKLKKEISNLLEPQKNQLLEKMKEHIISRDLLLMKKNAQMKVKDLNEEREKITNEFSEELPTEVKSDINESEFQKIYNEFSISFSNLLKRWGFSEKTNVKYEDGEFYVDDKLIKNHGQGVRAIINSGFTICLLEFCKANNKPHPGFVILDSPLTSFKERKELDKVDKKIQKAFFLDCATHYMDSQIIILDNEEPSDSIKGKINYIEFTKNKDKGRYGFFN